MASNEENPEPHGSVLKQSIRLRKKTDCCIYLDEVVGKPIEVINCTKLPTKKIVLRRFRNFDDSTPRKEIAEKISQEIIDIWDKAYLPHKRKDHVQEKVLKCILSLKAVIKHWKRYKNKGTNVIENELFDISVANLYQVLQNTRTSFWQEDWSFYQGMLKHPQEGSMISRDNVLEKRRKKAAARSAERGQNPEVQALEENSPRTTDHATISKRKKQTSLIDGLDTLSPTPLLSKRRRRASYSFKSGDDDDDCKEIDDDDDKDYEPGRREKKELKEMTTVEFLEVPKLSPKCILKQTAATATRHGLSSTAHMALVVSTIKAGGGETKDLIVSKATAIRHRRKEQATQADGVQQSFKEEWKGYPKVLHWDGKIMDVMTSKGALKKDVNAVVLSVPGTDTSPIAISIPTVDSGTGVNLANSVIDKASGWCRKEEIVGGVFDTTSSNTGKIEGAMTHIESSAENHLLWLACRHHAAELHIKHPYEKIMHTTSAPSDRLFTAFQEWYNTQRMDNEQFPDHSTFRKWDWGEEDQNSPIGPYFREVNWFAKQTLDWAQDVLTDDVFERGDYRELCQLINFVLGGKVRFNIFLCSV